MFKKQNSPRFNAVVAIPVVGEDPGLIEFTFKHLRRKEFNALMDDLRAGNLGEADMLEQLIDGWNEAHPESLVTAPYSREALDALLDEFWGTGSAIVGEYAKAHAEAKRKN